MARQFRIAALVLALCAQWAPAGAQTVYRCGGSYSNQPCAGGSVVQTDDARSAAQRAESNATTRRDAAVARTMEQDRLKQEAKPAQAVIPMPTPEEAPGVDRTAPKAKTKKPELFTAVAPKKPGEKPDKKPRKQKKKAAPKAAA